MGKIQIFTKEQQFILDKVGKNDFLRSHFYFTGGTALSAFYLYHRYSEDLGFFSPDKLPNQLIFNLLSEWALEHKFKFQGRFVDVVYIFDLIFKNKSKLKLDFAYYPYKRLEKGTITNGLDTDSLIDIAVNKLLTITQRSDVKDFVDLYFLLKKFTVWDLIEGVRIKFKEELEPFILASDFLKVEDFDFLPRMVKPLNLTALKSFFRQRAKEIGSEVVS